MSARRVFKLRILRYIARMQSARKFKFCTFVWSDIANTARCEKFVYFKRRLSTVRCLVTALIHNYLRSLGLYTLYLILKRLVTDAFDKSLHL